MHIHYIYLSRIIKTTKILFAIIPSINSSLYNMNGSILPIYERYSISSIEPPPDSTDNPREFKVVKQFKEITFPIIFRTPRQTNGGNCRPVRNPHVKEQAFWTATKRITFTFLLITGLCKGPEPAHIPRKEEKNFSNAQETTLVLNKIKRNTNSRDEATLKIHRPACQYFFDHIIQNIIRSTAPCKS